MKIIILTKGFIAVISKEDWKQVKRFKWHVHTSKGDTRKTGQPYARTTIEGRKVYLHRFIMSATEGEHVDHLNHCTLDNLRENLEVVSHTENLKRRRKK
jgi:hypothetical protein